MSKYNNSRDCDIYVIDNTSKEAFAAYEKNMIRSGALKYQSTCIRDNWFCTFIKKETLIQAYYTQNDKRTHIIVDHHTDRFELEGRTGDKETALYQFEVDYRHIDCGMCYIIQTGRDRFFLIDSAHMNSEQDHRRIYSMLKKISNNAEKIVIAGWFLTHAHQDHIVKFMDFVNEGFSDVKIEAVYCNFPMTNVDGSETWKTADIVTMLEFEQFMDNHQEWKYIRLHTGQQFYVDNLKVNVLFTHEDICDEPLVCYNDATTVIQIEIGKNKLMFLGDSNVRACVEMSARYGKNLKSDIVQAAHHGLNGSNAGIYYMIMPETALYPTDWRYLNLQMETEANIVLDKLCKEKIIAGEGTYKFVFPYHVGESVLISREINN